MGKMHRTSKGQMIDMDALRLASEKSTAVGNMGVNGRGDKLARGGRVDEPVEKQTRAYHRQNPKTKPKQISIKEDVSATEDVELEDIKQNMPKEKPKAKTKKKTISKSKEVELEDGSIQIVDDES